MFKAFAPGKGRLLISPSAEPHSPLLAILRLGCLNHRFPSRSDQRRFLLTSPESSKKDIAPKCFQELLTQLKADALFSATGGKDEKGAATIGETLASIKIPEGFVAGYRPLAPHDVVGMLFAADSRIAERLSASQYSEIPATADSHADLDKRLEIQRYLRKAGFEHLVLAGLHSALFGMAWVVAYRHRTREAFSDEELETARYTVPGVLFKFLRDRGAKYGRAETVRAAARGGVVPLDPRRLRIAIFEAQGYKPKAIAKQLFKSTSAVSNDLTDIRDRLGVEGRHITLLDLEHYAERVVSKHAK
jgi:DNA-binding CsgD family transcriptional regulator